VDIVATQRQLARALLGKDTAVGSYRMELFTCTGTCNALSVTCSLSWIRSRLGREGTRGEAGRRGLPIKATCPRNGLPARDAHQNGRWAHCSLALIQQLVHCAALYSEAFARYIFQEILVDAMTSKRKATARPTGNPC
jgi:hypothetical protein